MCSNGYGLGPCHHGFHTNIANEGSFSKSQVRGHRWGASQKISGWCDKSMPVVPDRPRFYDFWTNTTFTDARDAR